MKGNSNINRGLRFSDISNRNKSNKESTNKDNPGFGNPKVNNRDNLRSSNLNNSNNRDNLRFSNLSNISNPNNSIHNFGASNARGNYNTKSLMENLNEQIEIDGRRTTSLKALPSISVE